MTSSPLNNIPPSIRWPSALLSCKRCDNGSGINHSHFCLQVVEVVGLEVHLRSLPLQWGEWYGARRVFSLPTCHDFPSHLALLIPSLETDCPMCYLPKGPIMVDGYLGTLTTEERTLLHLLHQQLPSGGWEAPATLTQAGISAAVHIQRKHIPRTLKRMEANGLLTVAQRHIPGGKQRKRVYTLTESGQERSESLRDRILSEQVQHNGQGVALRTLWTSPQPMLELLSHLDEGMTYHDALWFLPCPTRRHRFN